MDPSFPMEGFVGENDGEKTFDVVAGAVDTHMKFEAECSSMFVSDSKFMI